MWVVHSHSRTAGNQHYLEVGFQRDRSRLTSALDRYGRYGGSSRADVHPRLGCCKTCSSRSTDHPVGFPHLQPVVAHLLRDDTAYRLGRVTSYPLKDIDPLGTFDARNPPRLTCCEARAEIRNGRRSGYGNAARPAMRSVSAGAPASTGCALARRSAWGRVRATHGSFPCQADPS